MANIEARNHNDADAGTIGRTKMNAVIVSFHFLAPQRPCEQLLQAHQRFLDRLPGLEASVALDSRSELAFLLTYEDRRTLRAYFDSEEFEQLSTQPGCNDVFVKEFSILSIPEDRIVLESRTAESIETSAGAPV